MSSGSPYHPSNETQPPMIELPTSPKSVGTIEVKHTTARSSPITSLLLSKPFVGGIAAYALLASGGAGYLLSRALKIPGLDGQIEDLEKQVDELSVEVNRLETVRKNLTSEVDRLGDEVDELGTVNDDLRGVRDDLTMEVDFLEDSVENLNTTVGSLSGQVDRLERENIIFGELNKNLTRNNEEFARQNEELQKSSSRFQELNDQLAAENENLSELNDALNSTQLALTALNQDLNNSVYDLLGQLGDLQNLTESIRGENKEFDRLNNLLRNQTEQLSQVNNNLSEELETLNNEVVMLTAENERFSQLNGDLLTIVTFLNVTADGIEESYAAITDFLAQEIRINRNAALEATHNTFAQRVAYWPCSFQPLFGMDAFGQDYNVRIGNLADYTRVMDHVDDWVLSRVCVERADFEKFLAVEVASENEEEVEEPPVSSTVSQIISAVVEYTTAAFDFYFPDEDEEGLDSEVWVNAGYDCAKFPANATFSYS